MNGISLPSLLFIFFISRSLLIYAQTDNVGPGRAITLDGVNDYIEVGNYKNINFPFAISAWIFLNPSLSNASPIFVTNNNKSTYRGFWFIISPSTLLCEFGDGTGGNNPVYMQGKVASISNVVGRWVHACAVMTSPSDISLYINGIDVGGSPSGQSSLTMASSLAGDTGKIGYFLSNGVSYFFDGSIDEVRLWNRALTLTEVQQTMCKKLIGNESGLVGYWNFNETSGTTVTDYSSAKQNGTFVGGIRHVFSGAPIGDDSKYQYSSNWTGSTFNFQDNSDLVSANNIQGNPEGLHIYEVKNLPSQTGGLDLFKISQPYFGVFAASLDADNRFDVTYSFQNSNSCGLFSRNNNRVSNWTSSSNPTTNVLQQTEIIKIAGQKTNFDLGSDQILCDQTSSTLSTDLSDPTLSYLWSNGLTTSSINISESGEYSVKVSGDCGTVKDSVKISFENSPPAFSLGGDQTLCVKPLILTPLKDPTGLEFNWQDGSHETSFSVSDFGKYWVTIKNNCGEASDTVLFTKITLDISKLPNVITPNNDGKNEFYEVPDELVGYLNLEIFNRWGKKVFQSSGYMNDWNGGDLDSGVYFLLLTGGCIDRVKDTLTVLK